MPTRNTVVLTQIIEALGDSPPHALAKLERLFQDQLLIVAGDITTVTKHAETLRLAIITPEAAQVLDHLERTAAIGITIDHVEAAINELFPDRFIEP